MNKVCEEWTEFSRAMSHSTPSLLSHNPELKVKWPKLEISKFVDDIIDFRGVFDQFRSTIHSNDSINKIGSSAVRNHFYVIRQKVVFPFYPFHQQIIFEANWTSEAEVWEFPDAHQCLHETFCTVTSHKNDNDVFGLRKLYDQVESSARNLKSLQIDTEPYWCHY